MTWTSSVKLLVVVLFSYAKWVGLYRLPYIPIPLNIFIELKEPSNWSLRAITWTKMNKDVLIILSFDIYLGANQPQPEFGGQWLNIWNPLEHQHQEMLCYIFLPSQKATLLLIPYHFTISSTSKNSIFIKILLFFLSLLFLFLGFPTVFFSGSLTL